MVVDLYLLFPLALVHSIHLQDALAKDSFVNISAINMAFAAISFQTLGLPCSETHLILHFHPSKK